MADALVNAFTVAAFAFMLLGILKPSDFFLVVILSLVLNKAAPTLH